MRNLTPRYTESAVDNRLRLDKISFASTKFILTGTASWEGSV